jgi:hypothetical protein
MPFSIHVLPSDWPIWNPERDAAVVYGPILNERNDSASLFSGELNFGHNIIARWARLVGL